MKKTVKSTTYITQYYCDNCNKEIPDGGVSRCVMCGCDLCLDCRHRVSIDNYFHLFICPDCMKKVTVQDILKAQEKYILPKS